MLKILKQISTRIQFKNPWWEYKIDEYTYPNDKIGEYHYVHTHGSTFILAQNNFKKFVMVRQFRYLNEKDSLEFPGGGQKEGITYEENAKKELEEETGYSCNQIKTIGVFNPYHGVTNEICRVFFAQDLIKKQQKTEESEEILVEYYSEEEIDELIANNTIWDGMSMASWCLYKSLKSKGIL